MDKRYYVYILASERLGTLYVGYTSDIARRIHEHRTGASPGFTKKHNIKRLVLIETYDDPRVAQQRERTIKKWPRDWKINLIERENPNWDDLFAILNR
ncbi:MAG: GIY-YIG nuclease family protein [Alphaproteobacteria bacterium]